MVLTGVSMALPGPSSPCALDIEVAGGDQQRAPDPCVSPEPEKMQSILEDANALAKSLETGHFGKAPVQLADAASAAQSNCFSLGAASPGHFRGSIGGAGRSLKNSSKLRAPKSSFHFFNGVWAHCHIVCMCTVVRQLPYLGFYSLSPYLFGPR